MNDQAIRGASRRERWLIRALWLSAAAAVIGGFLLRLAANFLHRPDIRLIGVAMLALGLVVALIAWAAENMIRRRHLHHPHHSPSHHHH
jgi:VIT1/CCC1 family predicted Fe2+/Mn2+ transporter